MSEWKTDAPASRSTADQAREGTRQVAETAREQAQTVLGEARGQTRQAADRVRVRATDEANTQTRRFAENLRGWSDDFGSMAEGAKPDSPAREVVQQIATSGRQAADYLDQHGVQGLLDDIKAFARRRPGIFLVGATVAGFAIARATKAATSQSGEEGQPGLQAQDQPVDLTTEARGSRVYEPAQPYQSASGMPTDRKMEGM